MTLDPAKSRIYETLAFMAKSASSPGRIELIELLAQGPKTVENLTTATGMGFANTSAHLKVLKQARLVSTVKSGTSVFYSLAGPDVVDLLFVLRNLSVKYLAEFDQITTNYIGDISKIDTIDKNTLLEHLNDPKIMIIDVRPYEEYEAGHLPGSRSIPITEFDQRIAEIPRDVKVVAYCRGPYCAFSPQAVRILTSRGYQGAMLEDGFPEWLRHGLPVAKGA